VPFAPKIFQGSFDHMLEIGKNRNSALLLFIHLFFVQFFKYQLKL
jgi:hypothetical protein